MAVGMLMVNKTIICQPHARRRRRSRQAQSLHGRFSLSTHACSIRTRSRKSMAKKLSDQELVSAIAKAVEKYKGYVPSLEGAIGALFVGKTMGWEVLLLMHNRSTLNKFQKILEIDFQDQMKDRTDFSRKSFAWVWSEKMNNFWKLAKGEIGYSKRSQIHDSDVSDSMASKGK